MSKREHNLSSHGKKNDKETQSPKLKIFNDFIQIENLTMEKSHQPLLSSRGQETVTNTVMDANMNNNINRNSNAGATVGRKKSRIRKKSTERSTSDSPRRSKKKGEKKFDDPMVTNNIENDNIVNPLQNEKSFTDKFWKQCDQPECKPTEDTFSCVSCALKKVATSEHACVGCLIVLFVVSVVVAVMVICRTTLLAPEDEWAGANSDKLKKRIEKVKEDNLMKEQLSGGRGLRPHWRDKSVPFNGLTDDAAFGPNLGESSAFEGSQGKISGYLSTILDPDKTSEFQNNERLKEFYRKLLQADEQIQNLKRFDGISENYNMDDLEFNTSRKKRSLRRLRNNKIHGKVFKEKRLNNTEVITAADTKIGDNAQRFKRRDNVSGEPMGFIIEKKRLIVQLKPKNSKKVPKCSHAPKDSHTHEKLMKHPFYKNTQRLDEWLDALLRKDIPNILSDTFNLNDLLNHGKNTQNVKAMKSLNPHSVDIGSKIDKNAITSEIKEKKDSDYYKIVNSDTIYKPDSTTELSEYKALMKQYSQLPIDKGLSSTINYGFEFSTAGMNTDSTTTKGPWEDSLIDRVPNIRRLMQFNGEDNEFGYEDFNDDNQHEFERSKRMEENPPHMEEYKTANPSNINNPNWKGPMPLYPDELTIMAKHADELRRATDVSTETNIPSIGNNKEENYQDYLNERYDNLGVARVAQDYSDYGVLSDKKEYEKSDKHSSFGDKSDRYKISVADDTDLKRGPRLHSEEPADSSSKFNELLELSSLGSFNKEITKPHPPEISISKILEHHFKIVDGKKLHESNLKNQMNHHDEISNKNLWKPHDSWMLSNELNKRNLLSLDLALDRKQNATIAEIVVATTMSSRHINISNVTSSIRQKIQKVSLVPVRKTEVEHESTSVNITAENNSLNNSESNNYVTAVENIYSNNNKNMVLKNKRQTPISLEVLNLPSILSGNLDANNKHLNKDVTPNNSSISDVFAAFADLFLALDDTEKQSSKKVTGSDTMGQLIQEQNMNEINNTSDTSTYLVYGTEELEFGNIGHRTRVLLSASDDVVNGTKENIVIRHNIPTLNHTSVLPNAGSNISRKLENPVKAANISRLVNTNVNNTNITRIDKEKKAVDKRNADDSNLIFWHDMYDDEYGVETERLEDTVRDKHSPKGTGFIKKSGEWVQDKIKKFAESIIKSSASTSVAGKKRSVREAIYPNENSNPRNYLNKRKRQAKTAAELAFDNQKSAFAALTMNMKEVCKKAAEAVHQTKYAREKPKEESLSTSLMQQLLSLMNDLVDYQVQQKTCGKLPPDLQNFLEWLTAPQEDTKASPQTTVSPVDFQDTTLDVHSQNSQKYQDKDLNNKERHLVALKDVQDLMKQYQDLNADEKSKVIGIKTYLDNQKKYLDRQIYGYSDLDINNLVGGTEQERFGRSAANVKKRRLKRKARNFKPESPIKTSNITANFDGNITTQQVKVMDKENDALVNKIVPTEKDSNKDHGKRNLQDVYYRAVADAKLSTENTKMNPDPKHGKTESTRISKGNFDQH